jgi:hypothetical protein
MFDCDYYASGSLRGVIKKAQNNGLVEEAVDT